MVARGPVSWQAVRTGPSTFPRAGAPPHDRNHSTLPQIDACRARRGALVDGAGGGDRCRRRATVQESGRACRGTARDDLGRARRHPGPARRHATPAERRRGRDRAAADRPREGHGGSGPDAGRARASASSLPEDPRPPQRPSRDRVHDRAGVEHRLPPGRRHRGGPGGSARVCRCPGAIGCGTRGAGRQPEEHPDGDRGDARGAASP